MPTHDRRTDTLGILRPERGFERFTVRRDDPPASLAPFVDWIWTVRWSLPPGETFEQETLPFPCCHLVFEAGRYAVHGPGTRRFSARLDGDGWVVGVRFKPAGFSAFTPSPMKAIVDRVDDAALHLGGPMPDAPSDPDVAKDRLLRVLLDRDPKSDPEIDVVNRVVAAACADPALGSAAHLAAVAGVSTRTLYRLLERRVGLGTRWIVRRARVRIAADRVARGAKVDWATLAFELGYSDQAHLVRDFRLQVGETPAAYARRCARRG